MTGSPLLRVRRVSHTYPSNGTGVHALDGISLDLADGEFVCVVGPSGCGKTTLLRVVSGLLRPSAGEIELDGEPLTRPARRIGFVFQQANLMPWRTAEANVRLPLELLGVQGEEAAELVQQKLALVGLQGFDATRPKDLSGGMAQRVALARALVHSPELLLLDEPFGSLDALTREWMAGELLQIWARSKVTVLMVTHSIAEAVLMADRVLVLSARPGQVVLDLAIELERPRLLSMMHTAAFGGLAGQVREAIEAHSFRGADQAVAA